MPHDRVSHGTDLDISRGEGPDLVFWIRLGMSPSPLLSWSPALVAGALGLALLVLVGAAPRDPHLAAGVFPPWWSSRSAFMAASQAGAVVAVGAAPFIVIVRTPDARAAARLAAAGALFSIDPGLASGCSLKGF